MTATETYTNETGTWGWGMQGLWCTTCNGTTSIICPGCNGWTCETCLCGKPDCDDCDNTGQQICPTCQR